MLAAAAFCVLIAFSLSVPAIISVYKQLQRRSDAVSLYGSHFETRIGNLPTNVYDLVQEQHDTVCYTFPAQRDVTNDANDQKRGLVSVGIGAKPLYYALYPTTVLCGVWIVGDSPPGDSWTRGAGDTTCGLGTDVVWLASGAGLGSLPIVTASVRRFRSWSDLENCSEIGAGPAAIRAVNDAERYTQCVGILGLCSGYWPSLSAVHPVDMPTLRSMPHRFGVESEATCGALTTCVTSLSPHRSHEWQHSMLAETVEFNSPSAFGAIIPDAISRGFSLPTSWWRVVTGKQEGSAHTEHKRTTHGLSDKVSSHRTSLREHLQAVARAKSALNMQQERTVPRDHDDDDDPDNIDLVDAFINDYRLSQTCDGIADVFTVAVSLGSETHHRASRSNELRINAVIVDPVSSFRHTNTELCQLTEMAEACRTNSSHHHENMTCVHDALLLDDTAKHAQQRHYPIPSARRIHEAHPGTYSVFHSSIQDPDAHQLYNTSSHVNVSMNTDEQLMLIKRFDVCCSRWDFVIGIAIVIATVPLVLMAYGSMFTSSIGISMVCAVQASAWFVFLADYNLPTVSDLSQFVHHGGHYDMVAESRAFLRSRDLVNNMMDRVHHRASFDWWRLCACLACQLATCCALYASRRTRIIAVREAKLKLMRQCRETVTNAAGLSHVSAAIDGNELLKIADLQKAREEIRFVESSALWWRRSGTSWTIAHVLLTTTPLISIGIPSMATIFGIVFAITASMPLFSLAFASTLGRRTGARFNYVCEQQHSSILDADKFWTYLKYVADLSIVEKCAQAVLSTTVAILVCEVLETVELSHVFNICASLLNKSSDSVSIAVVVIVTIITTFVAIPAVVGVMFIMDDTVRITMLTDIATAAAVSEPYATLVRAVYKEDEPESTRDDRPELRIHDSVSQSARDNDMQIRKMLDEMLREDVDMLAASTAIRGNDKNIDPQPYTGSMADVSTTSSLDGREGARY